MTPVDWQPAAGIARDGDVTPGPVKELFSSPKRCQPGDVLNGTMKSSITRSITLVSPFRVGRGPRAGRVRTFHGHSGGSIHSTTSRVAWPWPMILPSRSTLYL